MWQQFCRMALSSTHLTSTCMQDLDWMDPTTKLSAIKKLESMHMMVGYPDEILNRINVDGIHRDLNISEKNYFENYASIKKWGVRRYDSIIDIQT